MRVFAISFALLVGVSLSVAATAADSKPRTDADPATSLEADEEKLICRNQRVTGSRKPQRLCHTADEWEAMRTSGRDNTRRIQSVNTGEVEKGG